MTADKLIRKHDPEKYYEFSNENYLDMYAYAKELEEKLTKQKLNLPDIGSKRPNAEQIIKDLLMSSDSTWEEKNQGHDWNEAVERARAFLAACDSEKGGEKSVSMDLCQKYLIGGNKCEAKCDDCY